MTNLCCLELSGKELAKIIDINLAVARLTDHTHESGLEGLNIALPDL